MASVLFFKILRRKNLHRGTFGNETPNKILTSSIFNADQMEFEFNS